MWRSSSFVNTEMLIGVEATNESDMSVLSLSVECDSQFLFGFVLFESLLDLPASSLVAAGSWHLALP